MKILTGKQMKEVDELTVLNESITSTDLMERAGLKCVDWIVDHLQLIEEVRSEKPTSFSVFCGVGNNGGDGLVIARHLANMGFGIDVYIIAFSDNHSADFELNLDRLKEVNLHPQWVKETSDLDAISYEGVFIDAIFGTGLSRKTEGITLDLIDRLNRKRNTTIAIDCPSGLFCEDNNDNNQGVVEADYTLSFQLPKLAFLFPENAEYVGHLKVLDIKLHRRAIEQQQSPYHFLSANGISRILKRRGKHSHKGSYGHALLISGSYGKMGASVLASKACLRSGVGLVTVNIPKCGYNIIQSTVPEAMAIVDDEEQYITAWIDTSNYNAIGVGPGIGTDKQTGNALKLLIQNAKQPLVFDADAINLISENKTWIPYVPHGSILTPHVKEFERLVGIALDSYDRMKMQVEFSKKNNVYIVLKGAHTSISCPDGNIFFNSTGNPGMATGGSGDVLTGIITGLLAQGYTSKEACLIGVYLHGLAGDLAANEIEMEALNAGDIQAFIGAAFNELKMKL